MYWSRSLLSTQKGFASLSARLGDRLDLRIMFFLDLVHAAVRFGKKLFNRKAVSGIKSATYADGHNRLTAHGAARFQHSSRQSFLDFRHEVLGHVREDKDKFISAEPADLVIFPAGRLELRGHFLE